MANVFLTALGVRCERHRTYAMPDEPCWACEREAETGEHVPGIVAVPGAIEIPERLHRLEVEEANGMQWTGNGWQPK